MLSLTWNENIESYIKRCLHGKYIDMLLNSQVGKLVFRCTINKKTIMFALGKNLC